MKIDLVCTGTFQEAGERQLNEYVPSELRGVTDSQTAIPRIAKDGKLTSKIEAAVQSIPTTHSLFLSDCRTGPEIPPASVHLVLTSPPYWTLKEYRDSDGQMGHIDDYDLFLEQLDEVWQRCFEALIPGGRLICVVGDVCLSRRKNGRHTVVPLHASIQERCRRLGFDNLAPIIWHKIANAAYEVEGSGGFLGKPYEPNGVIKNDIEFILMQRKAGGYRTPTEAERILSVISSDNHKKWFQQIWQGLTGASTKNHPAPYPLELAERLIRMFSFVGDTVLDPFMGTGTTSVAASGWGRNSIGIEVDSEYFKLASKRLSSQAAQLFRRSTVRIVECRGKRNGHRRKPSRSRSSS
jgi:DNA modification methylase